MTQGTVAVLLTPPGRGAIATVLVDGTQATRLVGALFHSASGKSLVDYSLGQIAFGRWASEQGEELVVCRRNADQIEIHCHGGKTAVTAILDSLAEAGCQSISWEVWRDGRGADPLATQALHALAKARTERTAAILLDQYNGALRLELEAILGCLRPGPGNSLAEAAERLTTLQRRTDLGRHLTEPYRVVLAGRPNVGKSSLINALTGYQRSLVFDQPGTTRDVITATTALDGWLVELADTAGLRESDDELETAGIARARASLQRADLRVLVFDSTRPWSEEDDALCAAWPAAVLVHNKADLPAAIDPRRPPGLSASAATLSGIDEMTQVLASRLAPGVPLPGVAVPWCEAQFNAIRQALDFLAASDPDGAARALMAVM